MPKRRSTPPSVTSSSSSCSCNKTTNTNTNTKFPSWRSNRRRLFYSTQNNNNNRQSFVSTSLLLLISLVACIWMAVGLLQVVSVLDRQLLVSSSLQPLSLQQPKDDSTPIVHVIQTRFMQFQSSYSALGWARLHLFQSLTFSSLQQQTNSNFIWIIRTDPHLPLELKQALIRTLQNNNGRFFVVASNENPEGFRGHECLDDVTEDSLLVGEKRVLQQAWQQAQTSILLETRLDADDALLTDYVELVQQDALWRLSSSTGTGTSTTNTAALWAVWCAKNHMEWQYDSPWNETTTTMNQDHRGALLGLKTAFCVTPGLTWGYAPHVHLTDTGIVDRKHQTIHNFVPPCDTADDARCLMRVDPPGKLPAALRARTPTSAGMEHVVLSSTNTTSAMERNLQQSRWKQAQDQLFLQLPVLFGMNLRDLQTTRDYIHDHLQDIVQDAIAGQCTKGHSCKQQAKQLLASLLR